MASIGWDDGTWSLLLTLFSTVRLGETVMELFYWPKTTDGGGFPGFSGRASGAFTASPSGRTVLERG